jgi:hypothetical protein
VNPLLDAALFVLGVCLSMRVIAALHRVADLWYTIATAWVRVAGALIGWGGLTVAIALLLPERHRAAFLAGLASFAAFYVSVFALLRIAVRKPSS